LGDVSSLLPSKSIASDGDTRVRAVTTASLTETGFSIAGTKPARMWSADVPACTLTAGEILIARSNTPELVGRAALFPGSAAPVVATDLTIRVRAHEGLLPEYAAGYLSAIYAAGYWRTHAGGASGSMKKITRTQVSQLPVPLAPLAEQRQLGAALSGRLSAALTLRTRLEAQRTEIGALAPAFLRQAFSGEV
jgi:type I restriction enzyme S subunit